MTIGFMKLVLAFLFTKSVPERRVINVPSDMFVSFHPMYVRYN